VAGRRHLALDPTAPHDEERGGRVTAAEVEAVNETMLMADRADRLFDRLHAGALQRAPSGGTAPM
jgi:hypothetical protein